MREERNTVMSVVGPEIQHFCSTLDLEFQLVDLRWGINDQAVNMHAVEAICLEEIDRCKELSAGPNLIV